ncbi:MAG: tyrosine-type recombinase/integrase [Candidatus Angelobacter sp.]
MARRANQPKLDTPSARKRLAARHGVYWNVIAKGAQLGYRRNSATKPGVWYARFRAPKEILLETSLQRKQQDVMGVSDDFSTANGLTILSYEQARAKAVQWFTGRARNMAEGGGADAEYTVAKACEDYLIRRHGKSIDAGRTESMVNANIIPHLGACIVDKLTRARLEKWMTNLAENRRRKPGNGVDPSSPEALRRSKDTTNRVLRVLKAALNYALDENKIGCSGQAWRAVKQFRNVEQNRTRFLTDTEARNLVDACAIPFGNLVRAALYSGARYGEILELKVCDFDSVSGKLLIAHSKSGKPRWVRLDAEAELFFGDVCKGCGPGDLMFPPPNGIAWGKMETYREMKLAVTAAKIGALSFHSLRHAAASRWARHGLSLVEIASQLGHADTRITLRYAHLCADTLTSKVRQMPAMGIYERAQSAAIQ